MAYGVNPQGYHSISFGSFVPKSSFRVKQQLTATRRDAEAGRASDGEYLKGSKRFSGFSLPEIKVKKLLDKTKRKKHFRSHTFDSASSEKLRLPSISVRATATRALQGEGEERDVNQYNSDKRVVKNGDPWWKWPRKNRGESSLHSQRPDREDNIQMLSRREEISNCANHHLRQKLPPLVGYKDDCGNVHFSEMLDSFEDKSSRTSYRYKSGVYLNRRYYYSKSRDGIRPLIPRAKVTMSHACLYDLGNACKTRLNESEFSSHHEGVLNSMHEGLQTLPGLSSNNGFLEAHLNSLNSGIGTRLKQSLIKWPPGKDTKMQPHAAGNKSSTAQAQGEANSPPRENKVQPAKVNVENLSGAEFQDQVSRIKRVNTKNLRALAILDELIDILTTTQYVQGGKYVYSSSNQPLANLARNQQTVSRINVGDYFQKTESDIKRYDRFKLLSNLNNAQQHHGSLNTITEEPEEPRERDGLTQLLAIQPLRVSSECTLPSDNKNISKHTIQGNHGDSEMEVDQLSHQRELKATCKHKSMSDSCNPQSRLVCVDLNDQYLEFSQGTFNRSKTTIHRDSEVGQSSQQRQKKADNCDVQQTQLMCINLNEQYLDFSQGKLKRLKKGHTDRSKLARNISKLLAMEPVERAHNPRPDLEISGENLKHLYNIGFFDGEEELREIAKDATGRITISQEQLRKIQEIYDHVTTKDTNTVQDPDAIADFNQMMTDDFNQKMTEGLSDHGCLSDIRVGEEEESNHHSEDGYLEGDGLSRTEEGSIDSNSINFDDGHHASENLEIKSNTLSEGGNSKSQHRPQMDGLRRDQSWDLEREFARVKEMDLQQRLQMKQKVKEQRVLESVRKDLEYFQETLNGNGSPEKKPQKQRESLLPPPSDPVKKKRKASPSRTPKTRKNKQLGSDDNSVPFSQSVSELDRDDMDGSVIIDSEIVGDGGGNSEENVRESGSQLLEDNLKDGSMSTSADDCEDSDDERGENDEIGTYIDGFEVEEDNEDSDVDAWSNDSDTEVEQSSLTRLSSKPELASMDAKEDHLRRSSKSSLSARQKQSANVLSRTNTGAARNTFTTNGAGIASNDSRSNSRGIGGSSLPRSRRSKRQQSSEFNNNMSGLVVSHPETVKPVEMELREQSNSRQGSRLPTREKISSRGRVVIADSSQLMAHRKAQLAKQQLVEAKKKEALLEQEREEERLEKRIRQIEFEEQRSGELEKEQSEIRRQRQLKEEARKKAEELEAQRQLLVKQMLEQEAQREAQEKARHAAMLEMLRREADMRQQMLLHERAVLEEYQRTVEDWNDWEYAYIDYHMGEKFSQLARKADQSRELEAKQLLQQRMMEAFEYKKRELLEKLKAAQKQLMMDLAMDKGQLDHFLRISRAFVFTYFERVPDQTYMVPQEMLM